MKIKYPKPKNYIGPYQIAEKLLFWVKEDDDNDTIADKLGAKLDSSKYFMKVIDWLAKCRRDRPKIKIDPWDTWSMDYTLAPIILHMLKQLQKSSHGAPYVDNEDVPEELRCYENPVDDVDENHFKRWDYILEEMIFAMGAIASEDSWEEQFFKNRVFDKEGYKIYSDRITRGTTLFGKYFRALWD